MGMGNLKIPLDNLPQICYNKRKKGGKKMKYLCNGLFACSPKLASKRVIKYTAKDVGNCYRCPHFDYENCYCGLGLFFTAGECVSEEDFLI